MLNQPELIYSKVGSLYGHTIAEQPFAGEDVTLALLRTVARGVSRWTPFKRQLIDLGARLPPQLKCRAGIRLFDLLSRYDATGGDVVTNLGISRRYRVTLKKGERSHLLFGGPADYPGERGPLRLASVLARDCDAFVDVGAHLGYYVFYLRHHLPELPIFFFEPNRELHDRIARNVAANGLERVTGFKSALGRSDGQAVFYLNLSDDTSSSLTDHFATMHTVRQDLVEVMTFDRFAEERQLNNLCVKVDVENAEFDFTAGAEHTLHRVRYLIIEVLGPASDRGFVRTMIDRFGFTAYYINDFRVEHSPDGSFSYRAPEYNWLFCRETPAALEERLRGSGIRLVPSSR